MSIADILNSPQALALLGQHGDNATKGGMVAHINPAEAAILKALGGKGDLNPRTGLFEFDGGGGGDGGDGGGDGGGSAGSGSGTGPDGPNYQIDPNTGLPYGYIPPSAAPAAPPPPDYVTPARALHQQFFQPNDDQDIISSILGQQRSDATQQLMGARARGMLDDTGLNAGLQKLDDQLAIGKSNLDTIGGNLFNSEQNSLDQIVNSAVTDASDAQARNANFDLTPFQNKIDQGKSQFLGDLRGSILAQAPQNLTDVPTILSYAGQRQGAQNPNSPITNALVARAGAGGGTGPTGAAGGVF